MLVESNVPKISVLISIYNVEIYMGCCIIFVVNQTCMKEWK